MCQLKADIPVTLPLFKTLYCSLDADTDLNVKPAESNGNILQQNQMVTYKAGSSLSRFLFFDNANV